MDDRKKKKIVTSGARAARSVFQPLCMQYVVIHEERKRKREITGTKSWNVTSAEKKKKKKTAQKPGENG